MRSFDHSATEFLYQIIVYVYQLPAWIDCLLKHSLVSSTIVISVVSTFNIALVFLNLYAMLLFIVKSSLQRAIEIINLIDWLIDWLTPFTVWSTFWNCTRQYVQWIIWMQHRPYLGPYIHSCLHWIDSLAYTRLTRVLNFSICQFCIKLLFEFCSYEFYFWRLAVDLCLCFNSYKVPGLLYWCNTSVKGCSVRCRIKQHRKQYMKQLNLYLLIEYSAILSRFLGSTP